MVLRVYPTPLPWTHLLFSTLDLDLGWETWNWTWVGRLGIELGIELGPRFGIGIGIALGLGIKNIRT